jgi:hypothetical protein
MSIIGDIIPIQVATWFMFAIVAATIIMSMIAVFSEIKEGIRHSKKSRLQEKKIQGKPDCKSNDGIQRVETKRAQRKVSDLLS